MLKPSWSTQKTAENGLRTQLVDYLKSGQLTWRENARLAWSLANLEVSAVCQTHRWQPVGSPSLQNLEVHDQSLLDALQEDGLKGEE